MYRYRVHRARRCGELLAHHQGAALKGVGDRKEGSHHDRPCWVDLLNLGLSTCCSPINASRRKRGRCCAVCVRPPGHRDWSPTRRLGLVARDAVGRVFAMPPAAQPGKIAPRSDRGISSPPVLPLVLKEPVSNATHYPRQIVTGLSRRRQDHLVRHLLATASGHRLAIHRQRVRRALPVDRELLLAVRRSKWRPRTHRRAAQVCRCAGQPTIFCDHVAADRSARAPGMEKLIKSGSVILLTKTPGLAMRSRSCRPSHGRDPRTRKTVDGSRHGGFDRRGPAASAGSPVTPKRRPAARPDPAIDSATALGKSSTDQLA